MPYSTISYAGYRTGFLPSVLQAQAPWQFHLHANALESPEDSLCSDALERGRDFSQQENILTQLQQAGGVDPDTFISSNNKLSEQLRRLKQEKARLLDTDSDDLADRTRDLMDALEDGPDFLDSFDAELFDALVEKIIVDSTERLRFRLKNGLELTEQIERTKR